MKKWILSTLLAAVLAIPAVGFAQSRGGGPVGSYDTAAGNTLQRGSDDASRSGLLSGNNVNITMMPPPAPQPPPRW